MIRNRAILIAVVLVFSSVCRKSIFLMSLVLLVTLVGNAFGAGGLTGDYYHTSGGGGPPANAWQTFMFSRIDAVVNFDWDDGSPPGINADDFAVRWTGGVVPLYSEDYTFSVEIDDGGRLWVDGQLIIDSWLDQSPAWYYSAPIPLIAGREYEIKMEWYERGGGAVARLGWRSASQAQQIIPSSQLNPVFKQRWAHEPAPPHQAIDVTVETNLSWTRGIYALQDKVYFGTDPCSLPKVDTISAVLPAMYNPGDPNLIASTTYYWQIVETDANQLTWPGPVWNFSTVRGEAQCEYPLNGAVIPGNPYIPDPNILYTKMIFIPGATAVKHEAFFSNDYAKVYNRDPNVSLGSPPYGDPRSAYHDEVTYYVGFPLDYWEMVRDDYDPYVFIPTAGLESLERGEFYYWCVDESDSLGNVFPGDVWEFGIQGYKAFDPSPPNEAIFVEPDVLLEWHAGYGANQHDVYMSTSWDDVNDAVYDANTPPPEFLTTTMEPNHMVTGLPRGVKKYWRVDEVIVRLPPSPRTIYKGDVWEFTTQIFASEYRDKGYRYLSPVPMAEYVRPETRYILVRFEEVSPDDITNLPTFIDVTGDAGGTHPGQTKIATDDRTVIFEVSSGFSNDELVTVTLTPTVDPCAPGVVVPYQYQFMVSGPMPPPPPESTLPQASSSGTAAHEDVMNRQATPDTEWEALPTEDLAMTAEGAVSAAALDEGMIMSNGVSVPSDFPQVVITVNNNPSPGYLFLEHAGFTMMLDNNGDPVWYRRGGGRDFKVQKNGMITWTQFNGVDENFNNPRSYRAVNGYSTDSHELQIQEDGGYLLLGVRGTTVDMTLYHPNANPNANVNETVIQEFTADDELIFQWRAWDNFDPLDCEPHVANPLGGGFNFTHMNAVDIDEDGHILLSSRHISEVTKINRDTGEIIWRLCGTDPARSDFVFVNDPLNGFSSLHDIRSMGNGRYTIFDNGNLHSPQVSRGVEYELDLDNRTATMVWEYRDGKYTHYMGSTQRLPTGNTLITFVRSSFPTLVEVDQNGVKRFEIDLIPGQDLYRGFRFPWNGIVDKPLLEIENQPDSLTLIFNKFGDPNVDYYRIYGGTTAQPTTVVATSTSTLKRIFEGLENGLRYYFRVTAVDIHDTESDYSNEESAVISFTEPGQIVLLNGDFCRGKDSWIWEVGGSASAQWNIENGVSHFDIANGGTQISDVQLRQAGMKLVRGKKYVFEFDAWSDMPRIIEAKVGQDESPWTNYSKIGYSSITPNPRHFRYPFTMQAPSDYNARVVFNAGTSDIDVYIDNVSLINVLPGDFDFDGCVRFDDLAVLTGEWLKEQSGLIADLQDNGKVDFNDFAIFADSFKYPCSTTLVTEKDAKAVLVPTSDIGYNWIGNAEPYNDTGWDQIDASDCPTGVGYENHPGDPVNYADLIAHDVGAEMSGIMNSCYIRIPFVLNTEPSGLSSITLKIRYDDGFVAYINGQELTRDKFDAPVPEWNDNADRLHDDDDARLLQPFRVNRVDNPDVFNTLQFGDNILAIHGLNYSTGSSDFLISAELSVQ